MFLPQGAREVLTEGISTGPKGFRGDAGGGEAEQTWAEKPLKAEKVIDVIAVELAAGTGEEASMQGDKAGTGQGVFGIGAFIFANVSA